MDDFTGGEYLSIRAAFWTGRMGMPSYQGEPPQQLLEVLHAILAAVLRRVLREAELAKDLFEGNRIASQMFLMWLHACGLIVSESEKDVRFSLTAEGHSVLLMLIATRPDSVKAHRPNLATAKDLAGLGRSSDREERFAEIEGVVSQWDAAFLRRVEAGKPAVVLAMRMKGPMPVLQTVWALRFDSMEHRDAVYDWICTRLDRWQAWSELAETYSSKELTNKLLTCLAEERCISREDQGAYSIKREALPNI
ncbi:MAG: hypothetical protein K5799_07885 [Erythrobacter sp.]|nr:hypothetical protein [Erythrobacter sp.]